MIYPVERLLTRLNLVDASTAWGVIEDLTKILKDREEQLGQYELRHVRQVRDLVEAFHGSIGVVDDDALREDLEKGLLDLNDHVARLEEHA